MAHVSRPCMRVATGCTSFSKARSTAREAGNGKRQRWKGRSGLGSAMNKPREEVGLDSGDGSNSCTRKQHREIFTSLAFHKTLSRERKEVIMTLKASSIK